MWIYAVIRGVSAAVFPVLIRRVIHTTRIQGYVASVNSMPFMFAASIASRGRSLGPRCLACRSTRTVYSATILFPWLHLEKYVPAPQLRERVTAFSSQAAVLYALLGSVSVSGLLSAGSCERTQRDGTTPSATPPSATTLSADTARILPVRAAAAVSPRDRIDEKFGHDWPEQYAAPLYSLAAFCNLQGLLSSMFSLAHVNAMPDAGMGRLIQRHTVALHATGWLLLPAVITLSAALVCSADILHGERASNVALLAAIATGVLTTSQMVSLHLGGHAIKRGLPLVVAREPIRKVTWRRQRGMRRSGDD